MVYVQPRICPGEWDPETSVEFCDSNGSPNLNQTTGSSDSRQKEGTCRMVDFAALADNRVKLRIWIER